MAEFFPLWNNHTKSSDDEIDVAHDTCPTTRGGVSTLWKKCLDPYVECHDEGGSRILVTAFRIPTAPFTIINCYLPSGTAKANLVRFREDLDILRELIAKYSSLGDVLLVGDLNSDIYHRDSVKEKLLKDLICDFNLKDLGQSSKDEMSYVNLDLNHASRIDHAFVRKGQHTISPIWSPVSIVSSELIKYSSTSKHFPLSLSIQIPSEVIGRTGKALKDTVKMSILKWEDMDIEVFQEEILSAISIPNWDILDTDSATKTLQHCIQTATAVAVPKTECKIVRKSNLKPWYPELRQAVQSSKKLHFIWMKQGKPRGDAPSFINMKMAKREVRKTQRRHHARIRQALLDKVSDAAIWNQRLFHYLVRKQRGKTQPTDCIYQGDVLLHDHDAILGAWTDYFAGLASPPSPARADEQQLSLSRLLLSLHQDALELPTVTSDMVAAAIKKMKRGKAPDFYGLKTEQFKILPEKVLDVMASLFTQIIRQGVVPESMKIAYKVPVPKKGKDLKIMDNYRGIAIIPLLCKTLELICLEIGAMEELSTNQSQLQFGFTPGLAPTMATLIITETIAEARSLRKPLYIATLDARKAFDVVSHTKLKNKLFHSQLSKPLWRIIDDLYVNPQECIKWEGIYGKLFPVSQGVRQGGVLSPLLYKTYINDLLTSLQQSKLGAEIGVTYVGSPTVADDVALLSFGGSALQAMLNISSAYSKEHVYELHPVKSTVTPLHIPRTSIAQDTTHMPFLLYDRELPIVDEFTHIGLVWRSGKPTPDLDRHISQARATAYALLSVGLHGHNGLDAAASLRLIQAYVSPRLTYGLEACVLSSTHFNKLELYYRKLLRQIQGIPDNCAKEAVYILIGTLPIEAVIHLKTLSLFGAITRLHPEHALKTLAIRQLATRDTKGSWFLYVSDIASRYSIDLIQLLHTPWPKQAWKDYCKSVVKDYWIEVLFTAAESHSTLNWLILPRSLYPHPIWTCCNGKTYQVKAAETRARLLIGRHGLNASAWRQRQGEDVICPLCGDAPETPTHHLIQCRVLEAARGDLVARLCQTYARAGLRSPSTPFELCSAVLNGGAYQHGQEMPNTGKILMTYTIRTYLKLKPAHIKTVHQLCNLICHKLWITRNSLIRDRDENLRHPRRGVGAPERMEESTVKG